MSTLTQVGEVSHCQMMCCWHLQWVVGPARSGSESGSVTYNGQALPVGPSPNLSDLPFSFLICKVGRIVVPTSEVVVRMKWGMCANSSASYLARYELSPRDGNDCPQCQSPKLPNIDPDLQGNFSNTRVQLQIGPPVLSWGWATHQRLRMCQAGQPPIFQKHPPGL